jgi:hypothetical protein
MGMLNSAMPALKSMVLSTPTRAALFGYLLACQHVHKLVSHGNFYVQLGPKTYIRNEYDQTEDQRLP